MSVIFFYAVAVARGSFHMPLAFFCRRSCPLLGVVFPQVAPFHTWSVLIGLIDPTFLLAAAQVLGRSAGVRVRFKLH